MDRTFALSVQPTDGDTVTLNGVTFTFKTTLGSTAGNVLIGGSASAANTNLTALINAPGHHDRQRCCAHNANQRLMKNMAATAAVDIYRCSIGWMGTVVVSEPVRMHLHLDYDASEAHCLFALSKCIALVVQKTLTRRELCVR